MALLALLECWAGDLSLVAIEGRVLDGEWAAAAHLEAIVEGGSAVEMIEAEAGAGVVDFEELDGCAGAVLDGGVDVVGVTAGEEHGCEGSGNGDLGGQCAPHQLADSESGGAEALDDFADCFSSRSRRLSISGRR